ncbi:hypothetical protein THAOC_21469, partial [Thalassiosira oceanica]
PLARSCAQGAAAAEEGPREEEPEEGARRVQDWDRADGAHHRHSERPVGLLYRLRRLQPDASRRMPPGDRFSRGDVHRDERGRGTVGRVPRRARGAGRLWERLRVYDVVFVETTDNLHTPRNSTLLYN